jgi:chromobox protein 5
MDCATCTITYLSLSTLNKRCRKFRRIMQKNIKKSSENERNFLVERVIDRRVRNGKTEYLLKWQNFPNGDNTWEPAENLVDCAPLIEAFKRRREERSTPQAGTSRSLDNTHRQLAVDYQGRGQSNFDKGLVPETIIG